MWNAQLSLLTQKPHKEIFLQHITLKMYGKLFNSLKGFYWIDIKTNTFSLFQCPQILSYFFAISLQKAFKKQKATPKTISTRIFLKEHCVVVTFCTSNGGNFFQSLAVNTWEKSHIYIWWVEARKEEAHNIKHHAETFRIFI